MAPDRKNKMQIDEDADKTVTTGASSGLDQEAQMTIARLRAIKAIKFGVDRFFTIDPTSCIRLIYSLELGLLKKLNSLIQEQLASSGLVDKDFQETYEKMKNMPTYDHDVIDQPGLIWEEEQDLIEL